MGLHRRKKGGQPIPPPIPPPIPQPSQPSPPPQEDKQADSQDAVSCELSQFVDELMISVTRKEEPTPLTTPLALVENIKEDGVENVVEEDFTNSATPRRGLDSTSHDVPYYFEPDQLAQTLEWLREYRSWTVRDVLSHTDLDSDTKQHLVRLWVNCGFDTDKSHVAFLCAKYNEWDLAVELSETLSTSTERFALLHKLIGNWDVFRDRRQLKVLCSTIITTDPKSMSKLHEYAQQQGRLYERIVVGYHDWCRGEAKVFVMKNSDL